MEKLGSQLGQFELLDLLHYEGGSHLLPAQGLVRGIFRKQGLADPSLARLDSLHQLVELLDPAVAKTEHRPNADQFFRSMESVCPSWVKVRLVLM